VKFFQFIWAMFIQMIEQIRSLPRLFSQAGEERKQRRAENTSEAERLDRLRNPSKYRGK
jgi:hypothetical protein